MIHGADGLRIQPNLFLTSANPSTRRTVTVPDPGADSNVTLQRTGVGAAGGFTTSPRNWHTGGVPATVSTDGTNTTPSATLTYVSEVFVPANATITGVAVFNGATVGTDKHCVFLANSSGTVVANSATAGTTTSGADAYQRLPFTTPYAAVGPATYYVCLQMNGTTDRFNSHPIGNFGASNNAAAATVFGTLASVTPPTTFTADLGPMASLY